MFSHTKVSNSFLREPVRVVLTRRDAVVPNVILASLLECMRSKVDVINVLNKPVGLFYLSGKVKSVFFLVHKRAKLSIRCIDQAPQVFRGSPGVIFPERNVQVNFPESGFIRREINNIRSIG